MRLKLFDAATSRQRRRQAAGRAVAGPRGRGWTRQALTIAAALVDTNERLAPSSIGAGDVVTLHRGWTHDARPDGGLKEAITKDFERTIVGLMEEAGST